MSAAAGGGPRGSVPLFTPILPPKIESVSHEALVKWKRDRREYEAKFRARCRVSGGACDSVVESIKDSFDTDLLDVFCELELGVTAADVTEQQLVAAIEAIVSSIKNSQIPDIKALFKRELKMNMKESDVLARVLDYFKTCNKIISENGLKECFLNETGKREKCKRLISCLMPVSLKDEIKQCVRYTDLPAAKDPKILFKLIVGKAKEHERHHLRASKQKRDSAEVESQDKGKQTQGAKKKPWGKKKSPQAAADDAKAKADQKPKQKSSSKPSPGPCPKCKELHWLRECTVATESEKEELRKGIREARSAKKAKLKRLGQLLPASERRVTLNGVLEVPFCPDSGSDYTIIGRSHWQQLLALDPNVVVKDLEVPVQNQTFGEVLVSARKKAQLHVMLHTAAGPVEPMGTTEVLVADIDDGEFIVGNDLLTSLGIDVERQLEQLAARGEDETSGDPIQLEADELPVRVDGSTPSDDSDIFAAVERLIDRAISNGFPLEYVEKLRTIVHAYDVWRLELRGDPPANVPPLEVRLRNGARPTKCKPRKYPPHIRKFLHEFNTRLVELGLVYENPHSRWSSPVLPVKKSADLTDLRQTTDYRAVNAQTEVMAACMPILSLVMENAKGMKHFGLFDFLKGFWQLPLGELCQEYFSFMTDEKIFTPRRVPQGGSDSAIHFQKTMETCFSTLLYKHLLIWIDDLLLYAADMETYLAKLAELFALLNQFGLKLSAKKSSLYQTEVKWCGRVIDANGVRHDSDRIESLRALPYPKTAGELQQFVCAINWLRESIVDFARQMAPLQRRLDDALTSTKRTKRAAAGIEIQLTAAEREAFDQIKASLAEAATLNFPDDTATTCLFTDASDIGWAAIVTQVADFDPKLPAMEQQHKLLYCMSGTFSGSQLNWTVIKKEALPIVIACEKLDYLLLRPKPFRMYCDHRNLIHVFAPHENVKKHIRGKLLRWAMKLMNFRYIVEHVPGHSNVWADMISRWAGNHVPAISTKRIKAMRRQTEPPGVSPAPDVSQLRPLDDENSVWPTLAELSDLQQQYQPPAQAVQRDDGIFTINDRIWVPTEAVNLIQRLCIVAHCGAQGHRGQHAMIAHLQRLFSIDHLTAIVSKFVTNCLLCLHSHGGKTIPRPWGELIECKNRNEVLHFDYLYMGTSYGSSKYLLVLKDHVSHYCELVVADTAESSVVTEALLDWHARFGIPSVWVSDNGTHFKNEIIAELSRRLRTKQKFTPAYSPWVNGSIERVNRDILQVVRAMLLAYKLSYKDWVYLVPMIQASLNHTALPSLGNRAPVEIFTGLPRPTPLQDFYLPGSNELQTVPESDKIDEYLDKLRQSIQQMHHAVEDQKVKQRLLNQKRQRGDNLVNFHVGDYVLRSRVDEKHGNKLQVVWIGPYRVVRADTHSFRVQHLVTGDEVDVHASRLKMYADSSLNVTDELLEHVAAQGIILAVDSLKDHRWNSATNAFDLLVSWKGLQSIEDSYEPMTDLAKEIRILVERYVDQAAEEQLTKHWRKLQGSSGPSAAVLPEAEPATPAASEQQVSTGETRSAGRRHTGNKRKRRTRGGASRRDKYGKRNGVTNSEDNSTLSGQTSDGEGHDDNQCQPPPCRRSRLRTTASAASVPLEGSKTILRRSSRHRKNRGQHE